MKKITIRKIMLFMFFIMTVTLSLFNNNNVIYAKTVTLEPGKFTYYNRGGKGWGWDTYTSPGDVQIYNYLNATRKPTTYIHKLNTYGQKNEVANNYIEELWYYAVRNNSTETMDVDIYAVGAANCSRGSSTMSATDHIPGNTTRLYLYALYTGSLSSEIVAVASLDVVLDSTNKVASQSNFRMIFTIAPYNTTDFVDKQLKASKFSGSRSYYDSVSVSDSFSHVFQFISSSKTVEFDKWVRSEAKPIGTASSARSKLFADITNPWSSRTTSYSSVGIYNPNIGLTNYTSTKHTAKETIQTSDGSQTIGHRFGKISLTFGDTPTMTISSSETITYNTSKTLTYTYSGVATPTVSIANSAIATATINTSSKTITVTGVGVGSTTLTLSAPAAGNYEAVSKTCAITVTKADINPTVNMSGYAYGGTKSTPSVTGNTGNGSVTYYYNTSNSNSGGMAWTNVTSSTSLNAGEYYMYAIVGATTNYNGATTPAVSFTISKASGYVSLSSTSGTITSGTANKTFTVSSHHGGTLSVTETTSTAATASISGTTVTISSLGGLSAGTTVTVRVTSGATTNYYSAYRDYTLTVNKASINPTVNMNGYTYGGTKSTPSVTGNTGGGTVTYYYNTSNSNSGGTAWTNVTSSTSLNAGTYYMYAVVSATTNYNGATTQANAFTISKANINPTVNMSGYAYGGTKSTPSVTGNTGNGSVTYYYNTSNSNSGGIAWTNVTSSTSLNAGKYYMYAIVGATINYNGATTPAKEFTISKSGGYVNLSETSGTTTYGTASKTFTVSSHHGGLLSVAETTSTAATVSISGTTVTISTLGGLNAGTTVTIRVTSGATTDYNSAYKDYTLTVIKANINPTVNMAGYTYDGTKSTPSVTGNLGGGTVTYYYNTSNSNSGGTAWTNVSSSTYLNAGTYYMYAVIGETTNYNGATTPTKEFTIAKAVFGGNVTISGNNIVGSTLTANSNITIPGVNTTYQWYTNSTNSTTGGAAISGATTNKLTLVESMYGKYIYVVVNVTKQNYEDFEGIAITTAGNNQYATTTEKIKPTITLNGDLIYKKSQTGTVILRDTGGSYLKAGNYTVKYEWTTNETTPTTYSQNMNVTIPANQNEYQIPITKNDGTGTYYLHVKFETPITDGAGNVADIATIKAAFNLDNTAPEVTLTSQATTYTAITKNVPITFQMTMKDGHAGVNANELTAEDIQIVVGGVISSATKELTYVSTIDEIHNYSLKVSNITETGNVEVRIVAGGIKDRIENSNALIVFNNSIINIYADNAMPIIALNGEITVASITDGQNLNGIIDSKYISKEYEIKIPILVTEIGGKEIKNGLEVNDIKVLVNNIEIVPENRNLVLDRQSNQDDAATGLKKYSYEYTLTLKGIISDGYLSLETISGAVTDGADNLSERTILTPYSTQAGTNKQIFVDNTKPRISIKEIIGDTVISKAQSVKFVLFIRDEGAGITENQFVKEDVNLKINGEGITSGSKQLISNTSNNFNSDLGSDVETNYTYELTVSGIMESGVLRLEIPENSIIDKANNGINVITLSAEIEIDNEPPKLGMITSNADSHGEVIGKPVIVTIKDCYDDNGIKDYVWQRSIDGHTWENIYTDETSNSTSTCTQEYNEDNDYYYRVVVSDIFGNSSISDVLKIGYRSSLKGKPTIRLSEQMFESEKVIITAVIKSMRPIKKITVNGEEIDKKEYESSVIQANYEYSTTVTYIATENGVYNFSVVDDKKNDATELINISTITTSSSEIAVTKYDATMVSNARIVFTSKEPIRIVNKNEHAGITFKGNGYSTTIEANISPTVNFTNDKTFTFENKGLKKTEVIVKGPIITSYSLLRFTISAPADLNMTIKEINALVKNMKAMKKSSGNGMLESYYGFKGEGANAEIATGDALEAAKILGGATETFSLTTTKEKVALEKNNLVRASENAGYVNGNVSGMYQLTLKLLSTYIGFVDDSVDQHGTFRITITP